MFKILVHMFQLTGVARGPDEPWWALARSGLRFTLALILTFARVPTIVSVHALLAHCFCKYKTSACC